MLYLYELAFPRRDFGAASATAWILFVLIMLVGLLSFMVTRAVRTADTKAVRVDRPSPRGKRGQS